MLAQAEHWSLANSSPLQTHGWTWGQGPTVIFLSPIGGCAALFSLTAYLMKEDFRCVIVEWGCPSYSPRATMQTFLADLKSIIEQQAGEPVLLAGCGFGGVLALEYAARYPHQVSQLVVQAVSIKRQLSVPERWLAWLWQNTTRLLKDVPLRMSVQTTNHRDWFPPLDTDRWAWYLEVTGQIPARLAITQARAWHQLDLRASLPQVTCPVLCVETEGMGPTTQNQQTAVAELLPDAHRTPLHSTGMHPYLTHPHRWAKLIRQFVADPASFDTADEPEFFPLSRT